MGATFCADLGLAGAVLAAIGTQEKGISIALRFTGPLSFLFFWPAYAGSAMAILFGHRFAILARCGRQFGLAFASAQLVHFALIVWLITNSSRPAIAGVMPFFAVGVVWTYVLASSSVEHLQRVFSPDLWRILRNLGVEYIALVILHGFRAASDPEWSRAPNRIRAILGSDNFRINSANGGYGVALDAPGRGQTVSICPD